MLLPARRDPDRLAARPPGSVTHMTVDLQALLDDPSSGAEWDWPLRLIARWHCAIDVFAPRLFRVNRQFEYCWRLAVKTNEIDLRAHKLRLIRQPILQYECTPRSVPKKDEHITPAFMLSQTEGRRKIVIDAWLMRGFEVKRKKISGEVDVVAYRGPIYVHVPADAVIQGAGAVAGL